MKNLFWNKETQVEEIQSPRNEQVRKSVDGISTQMKSLLILKLKLLFEVRV